MDRIRPLFGSIATTDPLNRPSPRMAAWRTIGSSNVEMSPSMESANVDTPLLVERVVFGRFVVRFAPGAGAANVGMQAASNAEVNTLESEDLMNRCRIMIEAPSRIAT